MATTNYKNNGVDIDNTLISNLNKENVPVALRNFDSGYWPTSYVDDVFSTYLYTGNGTSQTINNGIDLAGKGGLVWVKQRSPNGTNHLLRDTVSNLALSTNLTDVGVNPALAGSITGITSSGFSVGGATTVNGSGSNYASWSFREAPKFFDVVNFTSSSTNGATFTHSLGVTPGMVIIKSLGVSESWWVWHRSIATNQYLILNATNSVLTSTPTISVTNNTVTLSDNWLGLTSSSYVAYLFAHDASADGIIQCGSFTTDSSGNASVTLGWEPQYVLIKRTNNVNNGSWFIVDSMRGITSGGSDSLLAAESSAAEINNGDQLISLTSTGFVTDTVTTRIAGSSPYIYLAIRSPNKPPTTGTQVYNAIARTGTGATATVTGVGFAPDVLFSRDRQSVASGLTNVVDKLRGVLPRLFTNMTDAENTAVSNCVTSFDMGGVSLGADSNGGFNQNTRSYIHHFFRRAPGFFDVVCYTGTGVARTVNHSLGVAPELMIVKSRSGGSSTGIQDWYVYHASLGATKYLKLNATQAAAIYSGPWNNTEPTSTVFSVGTGNSVTNDSGTLFVAYLFATLPGISKVGSYAGNGTSQTINCGFTTGARFILIKRTDSAGDWYVWDSVRGIVAATDPHLSLNSTLAEVTTDDSVDPDNSGFVIIQNTATNINVTGGTYIFLAIA